MRKIEFDRAIIYRTVRQESLRCTLSSSREAYIERLHVPSVAVPHLAKEVENIISEDRSHGMTTIDKLRSLEDLFVLRDQCTGVGGRRVRPRTTHVR